MPFFHRQLLKLAGLLFVIILLLLIILDLEEPAQEHVSVPDVVEHRFRWSDVELQFPVDTMRPLPKGRSQKMPKIQAKFPKESKQHRKERERRQAAVKENFVHAWNGYKEFAWQQDEVSPVSGGSKNVFGGWGATLVDSLDTLWIMGLTKEFNEAVKALDDIDFTSVNGTRVSVFETNIRYLGGLLSAYDLSGRRYKQILKKAVEVGDMLYLAFDTANGMPIPQWNLEAAKDGEDQPTPYSVCIAELGTFSLEFTRLSQLTRNPKYYDAMSRIMDLFQTQQNQTVLPGLWPTNTNFKQNTMAQDRSFTFGAAADSMYEYLPKQHLLLNGKDNMYKDMYIKAIDTAKGTLFFNALTPRGADVMFSGSASVYDNKVRLTSASSHLTCFVGGMVGLGAKLFGRADDLAIARKLTEGCIWASEMMPSGVMPEVFTLKKCGVSGNPHVNNDNGVPDCTWSDDKWFEVMHKSDRTNPRRFENMTVEEHARELMEERRLPMGFVSIQDRRYLLRPEAIESVFIMYRITGDRALMDAGWRMFEAVSNATRTDIAHASIMDVSMVHPEKDDKMESFWMGETLKYYYLLFSEPDVVSLDTFVFNTEAHPLLRER